MHGDGVSLARISMRENRLIIEKTVRPEREGESSERIADLAAPASDDGIRCVVGIPSADLLIRVLELPPVSRAEQERILRHRLELELPLPVDGLYWDFHSLPEGFQGGKANRVILMAAQIGLIERATSILTPSSLELDRATSEAEALVALLGRIQGGSGRSGRPIGLAHVSERQSTCAVAIDGRLCMARDLDASSDDTAALAEQIRLSFQFMVRSADIDPVESLVVFGTQDVSSELSAQFSTNGIRTERASANGSIVSPTNQPISDEDLRRDAVLIGLGLIELETPSRALNFLPAGAQKPTLIRRIPYADRLGIWAIAAAVLVVVCGTSVLLTRRAEIGRMREAIAEGSTVASEAARLQAQARTMRKIKDWRIPAVEILTEIAKLTPDEILVSRMSVARGDRVRLSATTQKPDQIHQFVEALQTSDLFNGVRVEQQTTEKNKAKFDLTFECSKIQKIGKRSGRRVRGFE
jgi:Tfp pilus assembly protein PilN